MNIRDEIEDILYATDLKPSVIERVTEKLLNLHSVSQRSELLIDYMKWFDENRDMYYEVSNKEMIDKYIKSINCG